MTNVGWKRKLAYCIAFSADGVQDVTRRYVRNPTLHAAPRNKCPEGVLMHILAEIKAMRRRDMEKKERFRLNAEDMKEDAELRKLIIEALAYHVSCILPGGDGIKGDGETHQTSSDGDAQKVIESRQETRTARQNESAPSRDQRQQ